MIAIELCDEYGTYDCVLFGSYVAQLFSLLTTRVASHATVVIQYAKVQLVRGRAVFHTLNNLTEISVNPDLTEVKQFEQRMLHRGFSQTPFMVSIATGNTSLEDDLMGYSPIIKLDALKSIQKAGVYRVEATDLSISDKDKWFYNECSCKALLIENEGGNICVFCNQANCLSYPRYSVPIVVMDSTGTATFTSLDRQAMFLLNTRCSDVFPHPNPVDPFDLSFSKQSSSYPSLLTQLIGGHYVFKVELSTVKGSFQYTVFRMFPKKTVGLQIVPNNLLESSEKVKPAVTDSGKGKLTHYTPDCGVCPYPSRKRSSGLINVYFDGQPSGLKKLAMACDFVETNFQSDVPSKTFVPSLLASSADVFPQVADVHAPKSVSSSSNCGVEYKK
ncbi:hypothetical protein RIF29_33777 [Crotalaria pallida]|uniref:Replication factor A C-terminal domain-containing protein n=1 Tax=Crotalaria pallida TaxID=3830 RepID=A0AAN9EE43_CROPI